MPRSLYRIADEIRLDWRYKENKQTAMADAAKPYVAALSQLNSIKDNFGYDPAKEIVARFLSNAKSWRGPVAKRIKAELRALLK